MDWKWVRESAHGRWGFKMSRSELNISGSGWKKAGNEEEGVKNK